MHTFNDMQGRTWTVTINVDAISHVRGLLGINLLEANGGKLLDMVSDDPVLLCDILFALVKSEADARQVSKEDLARALSGDVLDQAEAALLDELADFFQSWKRTVFRGMVAKHRKLKAMAMEFAMKRLESEEIERKVIEALNTESDEQKTGGV